MTNKRSIKRNKNENPLPPILQNPLHQLNQISQDLKVKRKVGLIHR